MVSLQDQLRLDIMEYLATHNISMKRFSQQIGMAETTINKFMGARQRTTPLTMGKLRLAITQPTRERDPRES